MSADAAAGKLPPRVIVDPAKAAGMGNAVFPCPHCLGLILMIQQNYAVTAANDDQDD